jgi:hypothetical protein
MTTGTEAPVKAPEQAARWEDFVDVFFAPTDLFARRKDESWVKPFLLLAAVSIVLYYIFLPIGGQLWEAAMAENAPANASAEQLQQSAKFMKYLGGIFMLFGYFFIVLVTAVGLKLGSAVLEPSAKWREAFLIATFAMYVAVVQQIAVTISVFFASQSGNVSMTDSSFGPMRFMPDADPVMKALLGRFDLFAIWSLVLCAIGLTVVVGMPRVKAFATAAIAWLVVTLPAVVGAIFSAGKAG